MGQKNEKSSLLLISNRASSEQGQLGDLLFCTSVVRIHLTNAHIRHWYKSPHCCLRSSLAISRKRLVRHVYIGGDVRGGKFGLIRARPLFRLKSCAAGMLTLTSDGDGMRTKPCVLFDGCR